MTSPRPLPAIRVLSSMATKAVLADLCRAYTDVTGQAVTVESVGGVDAANRVMADEAVDVVEFVSFSNLRTQVQITVSAAGVSAFRTSDGVPHMVVERKSTGIV